MRKILFLNLTAFSQNGGIEKFNRCFLKALMALGDEREIVSRSLSMYDDKADEKYYSNKLYKGFRKNKALFILTSLWESRKFDTIVIGHINLSFAGWAIKKLLGKKVILVTHGIEVWEPLSSVKSKFIKLVDTILTVSNFTKQKICSVQNISGDNITIFPNTIDPFFAIPTGFYSNTELRARYGIKEDNLVLFTLARVSSTEKYKGYDIVLECLPEILKRFPNVRYVIGGKYDPLEKERIDNIVRELKLEGVVNLIGFIKDEEIVAHYQMADMFIMPSRKEGFGIVFIEAMVCGLPVIAGNADGSVDALKNGELGSLVDPTDKAAITQQLCYFFEHKNLMTDEYKHQLQQKTLSYFSFEQYKERLKNILAQ